MVLGQPLVAYLPVAEEVLDGIERLLDLGADAGLGPIDLQQPFFHRTLFYPLDAASPGRVTATGILCDLLFSQALVHTDVALIGVGVIVIIPYQVVCHGDIGHVSRSGSHGMRQRGHCVYANVGLSAEVPLVVLAGLFYAGARCLALCLGRAQTRR